METGLREWRDKLTTKHTKRALGQNINILPVLRSLLLFPFVFAERDDGASGELGQVRVLPHHLLQVPGGDLHGSILALVLSFILGEETVGNDS